MREPGEEKCRSYYREFGVRARTRYLKGPCLYTPLWLAKKKWARHLSLAWHHYPWMPADHSHLISTLCHTVRGSCCNKTSEQTRG
ncbi:hypothetical protein BDV23DRAFT_89563 [Aspergillus alliaceus]|uniref:Uncharacterized protein n=1 Tax=Petromyces alliaceus TaxID=209559 RepID=A0A5N7C7L6_PETAA|nr:hypothetical protein BDV23DRAFT_89563 [Aspergillus alliaceus]